jgi:hypothetical protein
MTLATAGWGAWWIGFLLWRVAPGHAPAPWGIYAISTSLGLAGLVAAVLCVRAAPAWLLLTCIPFFANLSLLLMPVLLPGGGGLLGDLARARDAGTGPPQRESSAPLAPMLLKPGTAPDTPVEWPA